MGWMNFKKVKRRKRREELTGSLHTLLPHFLHQKRQLRPLGNSIMIPNSIKAVEDCNCLLLATLKSDLLIDVNSAVRFCHIVSYVCKSIKLLYHMCRNCYKI